MKSLLDSCCFAVAALFFAESAAAAAFSLDGTWQAEVVPDAQGDAIPARFSRNIPVPGHWPLMKPSAVSGKTDALWCRTVWNAPTEIPPRATLRIGKASFGTTVFVNGRKAGFFPYNFVASETDIRPFLKPGAENEIVVRLGNAWTQNSNGHPMAHTGKDEERYNYYQGIMDSVSLTLSGWPAVERLETRADLERGVVNVRAAVTNGAAHAVSALLSAAVGDDSVSVAGADLAPGEEREIEFAVAISGFDCERDCWTPENPVLKTLVVRTAGDEMSRRFGMRTFDVNPHTRRFRLNGRDRMLLGTNTDLFRFYDDPQCGDKPWNREWMRAFFAQLKSIGWDSFRNCISAPPDFWYDLCDEMGLMVQDEYPNWKCGSEKWFDGRPGWPMCDCNDTTLFPEMLAWVRERGTHPSIVFIDLQNEAQSEWFDSLAHRIAPYDFQRRPIDTGWSVNTIPNSPVECHPYLFNMWDFSLGYLNANFSRLWSALTPEAEISARPVIINEYGWDWINRNGDATKLGRQNYRFIMPDSTREQRRDYYAWSVGVLTEYWRSTRRASGLFHFTSLTYGFDDEDAAFTGDILAPDLSAPRIRPEVARSFRSAFAPVAVVIDEFREDVIPGTERSFDILLINDSRDGRPAERRVSFSAGDFHSEEFVLAAEHGGVARRRVTVSVPGTAHGVVAVSAVLPEGTRSERRWKVLDRKPGLEQGARAVASSQSVTRPALFVLDGSPMTRWESMPDDANPRLEIDLGEEREVKECRVHWFHSWEPPSGWRIVPSLPARTRYVMVEVTDPSPNKLASIEEIEIH